MEKAMKKEFMNYQAEQVSPEKSVLFDNEFMIIVIRTAHTIYTLVEDFSDDVIVNQSAHGKCMLCHGGFSVTVVFDNRWNCLRPDWTRYRLTRMQRFWIDNNIICDVSAWM